MEAFGSYETSVHLCRPHNTASSRPAVVQCITIKTSVDSALTDQCTPLQLSVPEIMVCIGSLFGYVALSMLKGVRNSEEPFLCRKKELVMSEHQFLCHSDIACDLHT